MKKLYFIRHGESEANQKRLFAGRWDTPLTERGRRQAEQAVEEARKIQIDCVVSSPLIRARQTAEIIAENIGYHKDKILFSDLFSERDYGELQGTAWNDVADIDFDKVPGIESTAALQTRTTLDLEFLKNIKADNVLLVGHGTSGRAIRNQILKLSDNAIEVPIEDEIPNSHILEWI